LGTLNDTNALGDLEMSNLSGAELPMSSSLADIPGQLYASDNPFPELLVREADPQRSRSSGA
jgi:hypothetical protein